MTDISKETQKSPRLMLTVGEIALDGAKTVPDNFDYNGLPADRKEIIDQAYDEFLKGGMSTEPADYETAEAAITNLYASIDKPPPHFIRLDSPFQAQSYMNSLLHPKRLSPRIRIELEKWINCDLRNYLRDKLHRRVDNYNLKLSPARTEKMYHLMEYDPEFHLLPIHFIDGPSDYWQRIGLSISDYLNGQLMYQIKFQDEFVPLSGEFLYIDKRKDPPLVDLLRGQMTRQADSYLKEKLEPLGLKRIKTSFCGNLCYILWGKYEVGRRLGVVYNDEDNSRLDDQLKICESIGMWWPFDDFCILTGRPTKISIDDQNLLHCETGPAIQYKTGYNVYAWHGQTIPEEWIENPKTLTAEIALKCLNIEQRRCACEIVGWHNILTELNAISIDIDDDPEIGELVEIDLPDSGREKFLKVRCATGRNFALPVPPDMLTALEANAWTWGLEKNQYRPEIQT